MAHLGKVMVPKGAQEFESLTLLHFWVPGNRVVTVPTVHEDGKYVIQRIGIPNMYGTYFCVILHA